MKSLNFHNIKKNFFTVTLNDEKETTLILRTPNKGLIDELMSIYDNSTGDTTDPTVSTQIINELYRVSAKILSFNRNGVVITQEYLSEIFDIEDITTLINSYIEFISEIANQKN